MAKKPKTHVSSARPKAKKHRLEPVKEYNRPMEDMFPDLEEAMPLPPVPEVVELMDIDDKILFGVFECPETDVFSFWSNEF